MIAFATKRPLNLTPDKGRVETEGKIFADHFAWVKRAAIAYFLTLWILTTTSSKLLYQGAGRVETVVGGKPD